MKLNPKTTAELERAYTIAKDHTGAFNDAIKAQAEKHQLDPQGLGRYIRAKVNDKLAKLEAERDTIEQLTLQLDEQSDKAA